MSKKSNTQTTLILMFDSNEIDKKKIKKLNGLTYKDWKDFTMNCKYSNTTIYTLKNFIKSINNGEIDTKGILVAYVLLEDNAGL